MNCDRSHYYRYVLHASIYFNNGAKKNLLFHVSVDNNFFKLYNIVGESQQ